MKARIILLGALALIILNYSCLQAGELMSGEAIDHYNEGVRFQKAGRFGDAEVAFQMAIFMNSGDQRIEKAILNNRAIMYAQQGDIETAQKALEALLKIDPTYKEAQMNLGLIYDRTKSRLESLEYWVKLFKLENLKPKSFLIEEEMKAEQGK